MAAWITQCMKNPANTILPSLDGVIAQHLAITRHSYEKAGIFSTILFGHEADPYPFLASTIPLRLFLGFVFIYAGVYQLMFSNFLNAASANFIGKQLSQDAPYSPIGFLLTPIMHYVSILGLVFVVAEIIIGICTWFGIFARPAALGGFFINLLTWFIVSFGTYPYFLAGDTILMICWLTLCFSPLNLSAFPTLDSSIVNGLLEQYTELPVWAAFLFGGTTELPAFSQKRVSRHDVAFQESKRRWISSLATGGIALVVIGWLAQIVTTDNAFASMLGLQSVVPSPQGTPPVGSGTPPPGITPRSGTVIAQPSQMKIGSIINFADQNSSGNGGLLVCLQSGTFVAYDATCTHNQCSLTSGEYNPASQVLTCTCHGARFNLANNASVVSGPAPRPLAPIPITVNTASDSITLA
jgi:thiosulfate dehydrogenase [quinone] large subunit